MDTFFNRSVRHEGKIVKTSSTTHLKAIELYLMIKEKLNTQNVYFFPLGLDYLGTQVQLVSIVIKLLNHHFKSVILYRRQRCVCIKDIFPNLNCHQYMKYLLYLILLNCYIVKFFSFFPNWLMQKLHSPSITKNFDGTYLL